MISIDVTDRQIKIIHGVFNKGKVKVHEAFKQDLRDGLVKNGYIQDIPLVATTINDVLKTNKVKDKEAIVSISSNQIVFKELNVPKAKGEQFNLLVNNQIKQDMGLSDDYNISFTIIGETVDEGGAAMVKVLATACPQRLVDCYINLFAMLGIALRAVNISSSCISRVLLADGRYKDRMPLLVVQIERDFINLNLYDNEQLSFSRYINIDAEDYDEDTDYITEAVAENIFRMVQFYKSRNNGESIREVLFYGDVRDFMSLTNAVSSLGISTNILNVPSSVIGYEKFEFTQFANAVGALYKRNRETEHINLLEAVATKRRTGGNSFKMTLVGTFLLSGLLIGGAFAFLSVVNADYNSRIDKVDEYINNPDTIKKLHEVEQISLELKNLDAYSKRVKKAETAVTSLPVLNTDVFKKLEEYLDGKTKIVNVEFTTGGLTVGCRSKSQTAPADYVKALNDSGYFDNVIYGGYTTGGEDEFDTDFSIIVNVKGGEIE